MNGDRPPEGGGRQAEIARGLAPARKPYATPSLRVYGDIRELTGVANPNVGIDNPGMKAQPMT